MLAGRWAGVMPDPAGVLVERKFDGFRCLFFAGLDRQSAGRQRRSSLHDVRAIAPLGRGNSASVGLSDMVGGPSRNRTGVYGFAVLP